MSQSTRYAYIFGGAIGDALLGVYLGKALETNVPGAQLTLISTRVNPFLRDLLAPLPFVSFHELPKGKIRSWFTLVSFLFYSWNSCAYEPLTGSLSLWWKLILWAMSRNSGGIEVRCQYISRPVPSRVRKLVLDCKREQVFGSIQRILKEWNVPISSIPGPQLEFDKKYANKIIHPSPYIVFHFFAPSVKRTLSAGRAREVLKAVLAAFPAYAIVLTSTRKDRLEAQRIGAGFSATIFEDLAAGELTSLIKGADAYVGVDTGITHLASVLDVPVVVLGNYSNPCWLPTYAPKARILYERKNCICNGDKTGDCFYEIEGKSHYRCMEDIRIDFILAAIAEALVTKNKPYA